jgi:hypothetical protein
MPRPRRTPDSLVSRLVAYVTPATLERIQTTAKDEGISTGALLDRHFDPALKASFNFTGPSTAAKDPRIGTPKPVIRTQSTNPHPGWRVNANNVNVCTACGGKKTVVQGKPCPGERP